MFECTDINPRDTSTITKAKESCRDLLLSSQIKVKLPWPSADTHSWEQVGELREPHFI